MATITVNQSQKRQYGGFSPFGNLTVLHFAIKTIANGSVVGTDSSAAPAVGDVIDLGPLPEGMRLEDAILLIPTAMTAAVTGSLGFKYEDGVDDAGVPQDAAYFGAGLVLNATGRVRAGGSKLVILPKPARLILTIAGAANAKASEVQALIYGELQGPR